jgi:hypothetical protein
MEAIQTYSEPPDFQTIRAILQEVAVSHKEIAESQKETDRRMKETDQRMKETDQRIKETDRIVKENAKLIGKLGHNFGQVVEHMVMPNLVDKFRELGFVFEKAYQNAVIKDTKNNIYAEVDITLENGDKVMLVEIKSKLTTENIAEHIERMGKVRTHADLHGDKRKFLGAVAGVIMTDNERAFAFKSGFYVIEPSGESFAISEPEGIYSVREW